MNSIYIEALGEFEQLTGESFRDELYPTPASVPAELLKIVSKVKVSQASMQQVNLHYEMQRYKRGSVIILPDDKQNLPVDFKACAERMELWEATL
jgi:hypothetical protein